MLPDGPSHARPPQDQSPTDEERTTSVSEAS